MLRLLCLQPVSALKEASLPENRGPEFTVFLDQLFPALVFFCISIWSSVVMMKWIWALCPWEKAQKVAWTPVWDILPSSVLVSVLFLYYVKCSLDKNKLLEGKEQYNKENETRSGMASFSCKWLNFLIPKTGCTLTNGWEWSSDNAVISPVCRSCVGEC